MTSFYISSVGGDIAQAIISILRNTYPSAVIWGSDLHREHAGMYLVDRFQVSPKFNSKLFLPWVTNLLQKNSIEYFIPVNEGELNRFSELSPDERKKILGNTNLVWAGEQAVRIFGNKKRTSDFLVSAQLPAAREFESVGDVKSLDFPVLVKPSEGSGSRNIFKCNNILELEASFLFVDNPIIQEFLDAENSEYTCAVFRSDSGEVRIVTLRRHLSGGTTSWGIVEFNSSIDSLCRALAESIDLRGSVNIQLRIVRGTPKVFEVNGRFSSTVGLRELLGFRDLIWSLGDLTGFKSFDASELHGKVVYKTTVGNTEQ